MTIDITDLKEQLRDAQRCLDSEYEKIQEKIEANEKQLKLLGRIESLITENERLKSELEEQQADNDRLHELLNDKDMKLNEWSKFSVSMAKKSSQEGLEKAFQLYINMSKRKTQAKREVAKAQLLDFIATAKLTMPDDIMESLNQLDDEVVAEPAPTSTSVTVQAGGINVQQANTVTK